MASPVLTAYYPSWKIYKGYKPSDLRLDLLNYVCYAFARYESPVSVSLDALDFINDDGTVRCLDEKADLKMSVDGSNGCIGSFMELKRERYPQLGILLSIGGASGSAPFPSITADDGKLRAFCESVGTFIRHHGFDGVDIDWEHPSTHSEGELFSKLIKTLRLYLPSPQYTLTAALPAGEWCLRNIDLFGLLSPTKTGQSYLDYLHVMTYDFSGPWTKLSGHQAQLHAPSDPPNAFAKRSIAHITNYLVNDRSLVPAKLLMGIPVYGRSFLGVNGPGDEFRGHAGDVNGIFEYRDLPRPGTIEHVDEARGAASCFGSDGGWVSYDCPAVVHQKAKFVKEKGLAGLFFWTGSFDAREEDRSLLVAGYRSLHGY